MILRWESKGGEGEEEVVIYTCPLGFLYVTVYAEIGHMSEITFFS